MSERRVLVLREQRVGDLDVTCEMTTRYGRVLDVVRVTGDDHVAAGGDFVVPKSFKATVTDPPGPGRKRVTLLIEVDGSDGGVAGVVQYQVEVKEGAMTPDEMKGFNLNPYFDAAMKAAQRPIEPTGTGGWRDAVGLDPAGTPPRHAGRLPLGDHVLQQVADLYQQAEAAGVPTARYISDRLEDRPSINATRRRIMLARERGFLPPVGTTDVEG